MEKQGLPVNSEISENLEFHKISDRDEISFRIKDNINYADKQIPYIKGEVN